MTTASVWRLPSRLRHYLSLIADAFWVLPACMVLCGGLLALLCLALDVGGHVPKALLQSDWIYNGGATGARTLLGAVAGSAIGVAGTVFSITIAALSLAAGQMGPRLLRNFTSDRGNQVTLGVLLGTFTYALMVLRTVRSADEGGFTPHLSMTVGIGLALSSVAVLIYFVGHMAARINVDTVIALVGDDLRHSLQAITPDPGESREDRQKPERDAPESPYEVLVRTSHEGYLQSIDIDGLLNWAAERKIVVQLDVRPGHYVFPGVPIARLSREVDDAESGVVHALVLGGVRTPHADIEFAIRQLVEVAMRALSPGINDPYSAISVIDRLGAALCALAGVRLPSGRHYRDGALLLTLPAVEYDGLVDTMFHPLRQYGGSSAMVLIRILEVLTAVATCETEPARVATLRRHAELVIAQAQRAFVSPSDLADLRHRYEDFLGAVGGRSAG